MKKLSLKDYYIKKELSEKHSLECNILQNIAFIMLIRD